MKSMRKSYGCPVELSLTLLGGKWKTVILARLKEKPLGYGELRRLIPGLSDKVLTERLAGMRREGMLELRLFGERPTRRYALSARGKSLRPVLESLHRWGDAAAKEFNLRIGPPKER